MLSDQFISSWEETVNFERLRKYRLGRVTSALKEAGLDGLITFKSDSVRYVSSLRPLMWEAGYQTRNMVIVDKQGNVCLYVASGDYQRVVQNDPWLGTVKPLASMEDAGISSRVINDQLVPQLKEMKLLGGRLGVDATTFYTLDFIRKAVGKKDASRVQDGDGIMRKARAIKSSDEIRLIRGAAAMVDGGLAEVQANLNPGRTENEVAGAALRLMYSLGTEWMPINPVVFSGPGGFRRFATSRGLRSGENATVNLSAMNDGYCAESTRAFGVGKTPSGATALRQALRDSYDSLASKLSPGTRLRSVFEDYADAVGKKANPHISIRGAGLSLTDLPSGYNIADGGDQKLEENNVIVLEAQLEHPVNGSVQISDTIHITNAGATRLTRYQEEA